MTAKAMLRRVLGGNELVMMPTAVVRQREMAMPWKPRKTISDVPVCARPQPSVKQEVRKQPVRKTLRRPMMSAMEPARRREQPHVSLSLNH